MRSWDVHPLLVHGKAKCGGHMKVSMYIVRVWESREVVFRIGATSDLDAQELVRDHGKGVQVGRPKAVKRRIDYVRLE